MAGSDFAKYSTTSVVDKNITAYANKDNSTGYNSIVLAYVELNAKVNSITSNYGYVTSAVSTTKNKDGETVSSFTFWDGATEHKDIMTDEKVSLSKGDIFTYEGEQGRQLHCHRGRQPAAYRHHCLQREERRYPLHRRFSERQGQQCRR